MWHSGNLGKLTAGALGVLQTPQPITVADHHQFIADVETNTLPPETRWETTIDVSSSEELIEVTNDVSSSEEPDSSEVVEVDPTGRYGRYNEILMKGASNTVYKAFDVFEGIEVAWNQMKLSDFLQSPEELERLHCEIHMLRTLEHRNIMKLYNFWVDTANKNINLVTEMLNSGTLRQYRLKHRRVDMITVKHWCRQILSGLHYLHSREPPVIHRDLKCDNIFVYGNQVEVKIGEFGLAAIFRESDAAHDVGTSEIEVREGKKEKLIDLYCFGLCILEMVTFDYPYRECTNPAQILQRMISAKKPEDEKPEDKEPEALSKVKDCELRQFIEKCLVSESSELSAWELLKDPFLHIDDYDYDVRTIQYHGEIEEIEEIEEIGPLFRQPLNEIDNSNRSNGGGLSACVPPVGDEFEAKITPNVVIPCMMAATGGLMFSYVSGIFGGGTPMPEFLKNAFPGQYGRTQREDLYSNYCKDENQGLYSLFMSSLYLAGLIAAFFASHVTSAIGRRFTMFTAGILFIVGVVLNVIAQDLVVLIIGRILLGTGVGFANQVVPLFLSEIAPTKMRGRFNILFQLNVTLGNLFANLVNYGTSHIKAEWVWRLSLALGVIPAILLTIGAFLLTDTPNSLIERGHLEEAKAVLIKIRGTTKIEAEFLKLVEASRIAKQVKHPFRNLLQRRNRPQLVIAIALQIFQQCTGISAVIVSAPVLFKILRFGSNASHYANVIIGAVNVISTSLSVYYVDKIGHRVLLLEAGIQMFFSQVVVAILLRIKVKDYSNDLNTNLAVLVVAMICTFISAYAWSWGPLGMLIPTETFPLEIRSTGLSVAVCVNLIFTLVIGQTFLSMLCHFQFGIFLFFSGWVLIMSTFVLILVPETRNVPIEEMIEKVWKKHWFWKRFMEESETSIFF